MAPLLTEEVSTRLLKQKGKAERNEVMRLNRQCEIFLKNQSNTKTMEQNSKDAVSYFIIFLFSPMYKIIFMA